MDSNAKNMKDITDIVLYIRRLNLMTERLKDSGEYSKEVINELIEAKVHIKKALDYII